MSGIRPSVLVFSGSDPSGGAGMQADVAAITSLGAHPLSVITALTVQDNDRVHAVHPVPDALLARQAQALLDKIDVAAVKIGIVGNRANAEAIAELLKAVKVRRPDLSVVFDPVLASGRGDALAVENAVDAIDPLFAVATLVTPNLPEALALCKGESRLEAQAEYLLRRCPNVLLKGGHGSDRDKVTNRWFGAAAARSWTWPRLPGAFHGTGCTLASAVAALLAKGYSMVDAIDFAQGYCHQAIESSYAIADGQRIPNRSLSSPDH
ncbi:MAG TPA: hydroxymethylpyrimidine/phosphomethylpyrimidine kinase [Paucimonas sp.]|nr:hydroxymethylpyrimidine/phosphomethylpyrimidine kinase [Paucimonas sp.]